MTGHKALAAMAIVGLLGLSTSVRAESLLSDPTTPNYDSMLALAPAFVPPPSDVLPPQRPSDRELANIPAFAPLPVLARQDTTGSILVRTDVTPSRAVCAYATCPGTVILGVGF